MKTQIVTAICVLCLLSVPIKKARAQSAESAGVVVLVIGGVIGVFILYHLWRLADRIPAPNRPPPPPPPAPPNQTGTTNAPGKHASKRSALLQVGEASIFWDITAYSLNDSAFWDKDGAPYESYLKVTTESSTGGAFETCMELTAWFNSVNGVMVSSDGRRNLATNWFALADGWPIIEGPELSDSKTRVFRTVKRQ